MAEETGSLSCTFIDRRSGVPLAGARATFVWRNARLSRGDADSKGHFEVSLPQGVYDIVVSARGYLSLLLRGIGVLAGTQIELTRALVPGEGQTVEGTPSTAIGGYVVDRLGTPVANVPVRAIVDGKGYVGTTDRRGAYVIHGVHPGTYELVLGTGTERHRSRVDVTDVNSFARHDVSWL